MIQRIQSLFLLCTAIVTGLLFFMPVASIVVPNNFTYAFYTTKVVQAGSPCVFITWNWMSLILNALITTLAVVTIVNIVLQLGLIVLMWLQVRQRSNELNAEWFADISFIFPLIGVIFTWLAIRGIVKDITLLKSFDRIR